MHPAALSDEELLRQCAWGRGRASGPGGQHRNKVETAVIITHKPTGVSAQASERRSQIDNKRVAIRRLRLALAVEVRTTPPPARGLDAEVASALWKSRRTPGGSIVINPKHHEYPAILAEALDVLADSDWFMPDGARRLGVTASQLTKLCRLHPPALLMVNAQRAARHDRPLR